MALVLILILLALVFGGFGLAAESLHWLLIIALILVVAGLFSGWRGPWRGGGPYV